MRKIAILAIRGCCDYHHIGGAESLVRRVAASFAENDCHVSYVVYGHDQEERQNVGERIELRHCTDFASVLNVLDEGYDNVITIQIAPRDRLKFACYQFKKRKQTRFHKLMLGTPKSMLRWMIFVAEILMNTRGGHVLTISENTAKSLDRLRIRNELIPAPVPESYFVTEACTQADGITLTYMGRLDEEKGSDKALELFASLGNVDGVNTRVSGYRWNADKTALTVEQHLNDSVSTEQKQADGLYSAEGENRVIDLLRQTDILVLPYKTMLGTIDPPLLVLEAMASGCACLVCPAGNVSHVYGESDFVIEHDNFAANALKLVQKLRDNPDLLTQEKQRALARANELGFAVRSVGRKLLELLK